MQPQENELRNSPDAHILSFLSGAQVTNLRVEYVEQRLKYGILFIFSPVYEYSNLEYGHVPV